jgi:hypothetical protein
MKYLLLFALAIFVLACQSTKPLATTKYDLLNGVWEGDCSMMTTGTLKGEIECPIMETESFTTILLNEQYEGVWISQRNDRQPDTTKMKLIMHDNQAVLQMEQKGKQWQREIASITQDSLKVYTSDKEYVALFRRKK